MKNEKKAWLLLFVFLFLVGLPLCLVNIFLDCANQIQIIKESNEEQIAKALINGESVFFPISPNERKCKAELIKVLPQHFDTVAIGSSLLMTLNQDVLGLHTGEFYNLGVSGMNLNDYMNTLGMMKVFEKEADTYIFLLHIDIFLSHLDSDTESYNLYSNIYRNYLNGGDISHLKNENLFFQEVKKQIKNVFSISYFKENIYFFRTHGKVEQFLVGGYHPEYLHYMPDGSLVYGVKYQQNTVKDVLDDIEKHGNTYMPADHINPDNCVLFDAIIKDLIAHGKTVILYFSPYSPSLYESYPPQNSPCFGEIDQFISQYQGYKNIKILGSFYPKDLDMYDQDYYDARHIRRENLIKAFRKR